MSLPPLHIKKKERKSMSPGSKNLIPDLSSTALNLRMLQTLRELRTEVLNYFVKSNTLMQKLIIYLLK